MIRIGLSFLTVLMIAAPCIAQQQGGGRGFRPRTGVELIGVAQVQDDLKATADQKTKLNEIAAKIQEERTAARGGGGGGGGGGGQDPAARAKQRAEQTKKLKQTYEPKIAAILDAEQVKRLHQISWQAMGSMALQEEEVIKALELSKEVQDKITKAVDDYNANAPGFGGGASPEDRQKFVETRDSAIMASLSDAQKQKFKELKGKDFDLASLSPPRRGNN